MEQDSTKDGAGGGERRNWRERLGVGQDLPKIADEFKSLDNHNGDAEAGVEPVVASTAVPGTPVARPAPMAPRFARSTAPRPANGSSAGAESNGADVQGSQPHGTQSQGPQLQEPKPQEPKPQVPRPQVPRPAPTLRISVGSPGLRPWATPVQPAHKPGDGLRHQRPMGEAARGAATPSPSPAASPANAGALRPGYSPRTSLSQGSQQRPAPSRGPAAYAQAAQRPGVTPTAAGSDSFGERLRAQREAAEKLAQQRLAAARERSGHAGADALTMLAPRKSEAAPHHQPVPRRDPQAPVKPAGGEQPRFTFAQEEIVAAQQETGFAPEAQPAPAGHQHPAQVHVGAREAAASAPAMRPALKGAGTGAAEFRPDYRHEDDGMFEDEQPNLQAVPPRASAADYSAAYREFEDEFEDEPRRRFGPLLLLVSLGAAAAVAGGVIYWYQQPDGSSAPLAREVPVITAPAEPAKADPSPQLPEQPQPVAQPATRKQIYDRIMGEETLEPELIVPTEEEPRPRPLQQLEQQQRPEQQMPRASGEGEATDSQSSEPLPLPLPPPPGAGEQGDLLIPGAADTEMAAASAPQPARLALPEPGARSLSERADLFEEPAIEPASSDPALRPAGNAAAAPELRHTAAAPEPQTPAAASIYPEPDVPLVYPNISAESPAEDQPSEPGAGELAALAESAGQPEPEVEPVAEQEEPEAEQASDIPLPKAKPEPPVRQKTAARQAAPAEPRRAANPQPSNSGPVQIIPADVASGQAPAQARAVQQPQAEPSFRRPGTVGREPDPMEGYRPAFSGSSAIAPDASTPQAARPAAPQQVAGVAPDAAASDNASGGGYVVQLASFRSEAEAQGDFQRLVQRHPQLVGGLDSRIQEASLGQSGSFYRLGLGPLAERSAATKLCTALIAAGEKDCLVRRN